MSAHTNERVTVRDFGSSSDLELPDGIAIACGLSATNALRLKACWNVCVGVDTETIEQVMVNTGPLLANKLAECDVLRAEVEGVRAALAAARGERGQLRTELDMACALLEEAMPHINPKAVKMVLARSGPMSEAYINTRVARFLREAPVTAPVNMELAAARAILAEVHAFATGAPTPIGSAGCHTLAQLGERVGRFLNGPVLSVRIVKMGRPMPTALEDVQALEDALILTAENFGVVVTMTQVPRLPLAMGNYETVVSVRQARERDQ